MPKLPSHMTVVCITRPGGPEVLTPQERPMPSPGDGQILIKVAAAGLNRGDTIYRSAQVPGWSDVPGIEVSGEVVAVGPGVRRFGVGDPVMSLLPRAGGYAQYCAAYEALTFWVPDGLDMIAAASVPETFMTVWHNVFERGGLQAGETLLVHGGASGIGVTAIQMAKAFGANVIATAGSQEKCDACLALGADHAINYKTADFVKETLAVTGDVGAHVILDIVGGDYVDRNFDAVAIEGRIVVIGMMSGAIATVDVAKIMARRLHFTGSTLWLRSIAEKAEIARAVETMVLPLLLDGRMRTVVDTTFPFANAADAHRRMESDLHVGKIVLTT